MPKLMKPPTDGRGAETGGGWYDGPPPTPGLYKGKVKYLALGKIKSGENAGGQKLVVLCEITEGKFKGAGVSKNLQLTQQGEGWVNQFLHSLTNGSDAQKTAIEEAFWSVGYLVDDEKNGMLPIVRIGKKTNPIGLDCSFVTTQRTMTGGEKDGEMTADISRFVAPRNVEEDVATDEDSVEDDFADALQAVADDETVEDTGDDDVVSTGDDPWTV